MIFVEIKNNPFMLLQFNTIIQSEVEHIMMLLGYGCHDYILDNKLNDDDIDKSIIEVKLRQYEDINSK